MKNIIPILISLIIFLSDANARIWINDEGKHIIKGELASMTWKTVSIRRFTDFKIITIVSKNLSEADQAYIKTQLKTFTVDRRGQAGRLNKGNTYEFRIKKLSSYASIRFWLSPNGGPDSYGTVQLIDPSGEKHLIYTWTPANLVEIRKHPTAKSYKGGYLAEVDVARIVNIKGKYRVIFQYLKGRRGIYIQKFELQTY